MAIKKNYPDIFDPEPGLRPQDTATANRLRKRLYLAVRYLLRELFQIGSKDNPPVDPASFPPSDAIGDEVRFASVYGLLLMAGYDDPSLGRLDRGAPGPKDIYLDGTDDPSSPNDFGTEPDPTEPDPSKNRTIKFRVLIVPEFVERFSDAVKKYNANKALFGQVHVQLVKNGTGRDGIPSTESHIRCKQIAEVTERLINENVSPFDPQIVLHVVNAISQSIGGVLDAHSSVLDINLPELDAGTAVEIIPDNVRAVQAIYFSAQLEEMKMHAVLDKLVEHFQSGMLPISRGSAADKVYAWIKQTPDRLSEGERRGIYGRVLGLAQGATNEGLPNREFADLWYRFLATISLKYREIFSTEKDEVSIEQVHKAARDLAVNISLHGYGIAYPAAIEMQDIVRDVIAILDEQQVLMAYGVRDRWQLVDRVSSLYLGGAVNGVKYRTMASAGEKVIKWLADKAPVLASSSSAGLVLVDHSGAMPRPTQEFKYIADLAERWLAVTGTQDEMVRRSSEPVDLQTQYTVPMLGQGSAMPQAVHDALNQFGGNGVAIPNLPVVPQA
jgi:hypothetical protein